ncbi:DNA cytosine methyltransferase [Pseudomonas syringae]|uniref:DNA cytosine methyltransferase n=1 Tax=Pseudomonas syringae TaxID=317 RepID=UPI001BCBD251|nr:DNA cytosine methyltransferase [Pseudomonas syringae]MBS7413622.1 DNA cytosine methyltransferase [Pseudomonas syringae]QVI75018.1 DNA cytosine methyltransferase [Pseudomonas syringae]
MLTLLDLFSGCGGLTLGSKKAGFTTQLAVDIDPILSSSFGKNFPTITFLKADVTSLTTARLKALLPNGVDGVIGGPPCQAFSGMGKGLIDDPRRSLLKEFFRIVSAVKPAFFMMENVPGLVFPNNRPVLDEAIASLGSRWEILGPIILDASDFGAPTKRRRVFVFGFDKRKIRVPTLNDIIFSNAPKTSVRDAIADLAESRPVDGKMDLWSYGPDSQMSDYSQKLRSPEGFFTGHQLTEHRAETVLRFSSVLPGGVDPIGKYKRLTWDGFCPTLRAGTGSDRGSFQAVRPLHPTKNRVITPRECARLQGFPDNFIFHPTVWHSCRMIGNSVSPIIAEALLSNIRKFIENPPTKADEKKTLKQCATCV